jgi:regulator of sirC expression with transglutaminase-like and TPR domain
MYTTPELALFAHVAKRPDEEIDLGQTALLLGGIERPDLDIDKYLRRLDTLAEAARFRCARPGYAPLHLARFLFEELGFRGNTDEYDDPRNSFLGEVLDRRVGIPVSLSVLMIEVGRRAGVVVEGVGFPGHFLARAPVEGGYLFFDTFAQGRVLPRQDLRLLYAKHKGEDRDPDPKYLQKLPNRDIVLRMLQNLREIYAKRDDKKALRFVLERATLLDPHDHKLSKELAALPRPTPTHNLN